MKLLDTLYFSVKSLGSGRLRSALLLLAMAIGIAAVITLTCLGEGARQYVKDQFFSLGSNLLIVLPGRSETKGGPPPLLGDTTRDLTLADALALEKNFSISRMAPITVGSAPVSYRQKQREVTILGSTAQLLPIRDLSMAQGKFLPPGEITRGEPVCVLGSKIQAELFGNRSPLGQWVRIGDRRFRIIGVLAKKGQSLGQDMADVAIVPVASAQSLFDTSSLFRILVQATDRETIPKAKRAIVDTLRKRHEGEDDVTVITQDAVLATFDRIFKALTLTVAGIAAISLAVAGILITNVMLVAVTQRRTEIGLLKSLGATKGQIMRIFLTDSVLLAVVGAIFGLAVAFAGTWLIGRLFPSFPITVAPWSVLAALAMATFTGLASGVLPALRAAALDPVAALARR
jgi:putative ABC transport system permease protein